MSIKIQNVLTRTKETFKPVEDGKLKIYVCGVTVYGRCHVGHLRCYLSFDAILRYFKYRGYDVHYVRNFTDIDDKIIMRAAEIAAGPDGDWRNADAYKEYDETQWKARLAEDELIRARAVGDEHHLAKVVSDHFINVFTKEDFGPFNLLQPAAEPRVSKHIPEVIALIEKIIERGFAYESDGDVYFNVPAYHESTKAYGKLSGRDFTQMMEGARIAPAEKKKNGVDFALWKKSNEGEPSWDSPWGAGRPGWHIECSAMSVKELGQPFDIHGGGKDLIFPHHENEIAQTEAATGTTFCNTWMHNGFVTVDGVKMSKSLGNFITIQEALDMAPPEVWRYLVLGTHYANPIDFSRTREIADNDACETVRGTVDIAFTRIEYFYETLRRVDENLKTIGDIPKETAPISDPRTESTLTSFTQAMDDDFNTARALANIGETMRYLNELCDMKAKKIKKLDHGRTTWGATLRKVKTDILIACNTLGLCDKEPSTALKDLRQFMITCKGLDKDIIEAKLKERTDARANKDWAKSDAIRDELLAMAVELRDGPGGTDWKIII